MELVTPKLKSATVAKSVLTLTFSHPLDTNQVIPLPYFSLNSGGVSLSNPEYSTDKKTILFFVGEEKPSLYLGYKPVDLLAGVRATPPENATDTDRKILAVKPISNYPVNRLTIESPSIYTQPSANSNYLVEYARVDDFIRAFTRKEAIEISNLDNGSATEIDYERIQVAIEDAEAYIDSYVTNATQAGIRLISSTRRRTALIIARYYLDSVRRRESVTNDYERAIKELELSSTATGGGTVDPDTGRVTSLFRSHRVPQVYNRETGKGFQDWWAGRENDYREPLGW